MAKPNAMKDVDPAFQGAGQKPYSGLEIWRIETFSPVPIPASSYGKFFTGDSYLILKTSASKSGALRHDIHYWLGKDTSQDEARAAAMKIVELDASLGGKAVQYREAQGHEFEKFLSYFKPCIIPKQGGVASGFKHAEINEDEHETRLFVCRGKHMVRVEEVPLARTSLGHDDIFILDLKSKIFQFNSSKSSIQELLKRQGVDVKGLMKSESVEEPQLYSDCTGDLQVWRVNGEEKILLSSSEQSKFYTGDCYICQYAYPAEDREEFLIGTWFGKCSIEANTV